jgi:hypothetical protein
MNTNHESIEGVLVDLIDSVDDAPDIDCLIFEATRQIKELAFHSFPASPEAAGRVILSPEGDNGRSEFRWAWIGDGNLALITYPTGDGYFDAEVDVTEDSERAIKNGDVHYGL